MIIELRPKATLVLPKEVAKQLKLATGDKFDLTIVDGAIVLTPVVIVEKKVVKELRTNVNKLKKTESSSPELESLDETVTKIEEK